MSVLSALEDKVVHIDTCVGAQAAPAGKFVNQIC